MNSSQQSGPVDVGCGWVPEGDAHLVTRVAKASPTPRHGGSPSLLGDAADGEM